MAEKLRSAEAVGHANEKSIADTAELFLTKLDEGLKEGSAANQKASAESAALLSKKIAECMKEGFDANNKAIAESAALFLEKMQEGFSAMKENKAEPAEPEQPDTGRPFALPVTRADPLTSNAKAEPAQPAQPMPEVQATKKVMLSVCLPVAHN